MTDELKPVDCGCGGKATLGHDAEYGYDVFCQKCGIATDYYTTEAEAVTAWNRAMSADVNSVVSVFSSEKMSDLIRREDAIQTLKSMMQDCFPEAEEELDAVLTTVREIPSAEPEAIEFEWCSRGESPCKEYDQEKHCCHRWTKVIRQTVEELKSHEPERKKGEWIDGKPYVNSHWRVCSVCHETSPESCGGYNFCPNCGADMRGD